MASLLSPTWLYIVVITGVLSAIGILIITIHSTKHQKNQAIGTKFSRTFYIVFYVSGFITCIGFAFLRTNLLLPMGTVISCKIGYYLTINGVYFSKLLLFMIFLYRIDLAFHQSALAYHRGFLACVMSSYFVVSSTLNVLYCITCWPLINFQILVQNGYVTGDSIGLCSALGIDSPEQHSKRRLYLAALSGGDIIFAIFVCGLFVYKLRVVIQLSKQEQQSRNATERDFKLVLLTRKQTMLVILACFTSLLTMGISAKVSGLGLLLSVDIFFNTVCVWLMFNFTEKYWKLFITKICCCCYCCVYKEDFLVTMHSISTRFSVHTDTTDIHADYVRSQSTVKRSDNNHTIPEPITKRQSDKQIDIEIKFDNAKNITADDLNIDKNENAIKKKVTKTKTTTTTNTTTTTTTTTTTIVEESSPGHSDNDDNNDNNDIDNNDNNNEGNGNSYQKQIELVEDASIDKDSVDL